MLPYIDNSTESIDTWILRYTENKKYSIGLSFRYMFLLSAFQNPIIFLKRKRKVT